MMVKNEINVTIFRESHGHFWMLEDDIMKLAPNLERDSWTEITIIKPKVVQKK